MPKKRPQLVVLFTRSRPSLYMYTNSHPYVLWRVGRWGMARFTRNPWMRCPCRRHHASMRRLPLSNKGPTQFKPPPAFPNKFETHQCHSHMTCICVIYDVVCHIRFSRRSVRKLRGAALRGANSVSTKKFWIAVMSAKNHKRQRRKRQSVTAKREKSQTPKVLTAILTFPNLT